MTSSVPVNLLQAGLDVFIENGYSGVTLEQVAARAQVDVSTLKAQIPDKETLLHTLLKTYSPLDAMRAAIGSVEGESAEDIIRGAMRRLVQIIDEYPAFVDLAAIDVQANNGAYLASMSTELLPGLLRLFDRLKTTGQLRPAPDPVLARTLVALLMGYVISDKAMPKAVRVAMRLFPQRAWIDGMVDLLLYGILEDDAR